MPSTSLSEQSLSIEFLDSMEQLSVTEWQQLNHFDNPFMRREFLLALEQSGAASARGGWQPLHMVVRDKLGLAAFMPLYLKNHSYGEYVFDWSWADAYDRYGLDYYPKLVSAVPYTPSQSSRILLRKSIQLADLSQAIFNAIKQKAEQLGASSWHLLFPTEEENQLFETAGTITRLNCQFHWFNTDGWQDFDQFLGSFSARKRKSVRKERQKIGQQSLSLTRILGEDITQEQLNHFYHCYHITYMQRGRKGYLNKDFFQRLIKTMPEQIMLVMADYQPTIDSETQSIDLPEKQAVAAALFFYDQTSLYGRYWGSRVEADCLHFEACYYQGLEFCFEKGLEHFDPGTQGEHKISRGFRPIITSSNHWLAETEFQQAVEQFALEEAEHTYSYAEQAEALLPFKQE